MEETQHKDTKDGEVVKDNATINEDKKPLRDTLYNIDVLSEFDLALKKIMEFKNKKVIGIQLPMTWM